MNPIQQPGNVGSFAPGDTPGEWESTGSGGMSFPVPAGLKFILVNLFTTNGSTIPINSIVIDGVTLWPSHGGSAHDPLFDQSYQGNPQFVARSSIALNNNGSSSTRAHIVGYFVEDK